MDEKQIDLIEIAKGKRYKWFLERIGRNERLSSKEVKEFEVLERHFNKSPEDNKPITDTVDLPTLCVFMDKSPRMIRRYVKQGMPAIRDAVGELSRFKVDSVYKWYYGSKGEDDDKGRDYWDTQWRKSRAKTSELVRKEKEKQLILFRDHVSIVRNQIRGIKSGFLRLPQHIAPKLYQQDPKIICEILDKEMRFIINQFAIAHNADKTDKRDS